METKRYLHPYLLQNEFTLDDIVFPPAAIPRFEPSNVDLSTRLTKKTTLKRPLLSSPMDTVTEANMAILVARLGGIGVIHAGLSIEDQAREIQKVRRFEAGFVRDPKVLGPYATVGQVREGEAQNEFSSYPITKDGTLDSPIIGIVTGKDVEDLDKPEEAQMPVTQVMTPRDRLVFGRKEDTLDLNDIRAANRLLRKHKLDILPIIDSEDRVVAIVTRSDLKKNRDNPLATKDENHQLKVWVATESRFVNAQDRIIAAYSSGASGIVVDSRNVYGDYIDIAKFAKALDPELDVMVGNIVHPSVLREVLEEGGKYIDAFRVGIGTGEICITTEDLGVGRALGSTLLDLDMAFKEINRNDRFGYISFVPDGGIKFPKHFLAGTMLHKFFGGIMMGSGLGGFDESPSDRIQISPGVYVKKVRGMGSEGAIRDRAGASRYRVDAKALAQRYAEGIEKNVPYIGPGEFFINKFFEGVRIAFHALGHKNIEEAYENAVIYPAVKAASKRSL